VLGGHERPVGRFGAIRLPSGHEPGKPLPATRNGLQLEPTHPQLGRLSNLDAEALATRFAR
jgi:hypothetical protein